MKNILVTGGCGFIGSNFINYIREIDSNVNIINIDKLDYCSHPENIINKENRYKFFHCNINNLEFVSYILSQEKIDTVFHFAAQSHVDHSFGNSLQFTIDNVLGTHSLLEACKKYGNIQKFIHISTDEVYGEIDIKSQSSKENSLLNPTNPYASSKAGAEFLVRSYFYSFKLPVIIIRGNNVYGPRQYPEKLIPKFITSLLQNQKCTIHGQGHSIRNFIYVDDFVRGVYKVYEKGNIMDIYNIGSKNEYSVIEIAKILIQKIKPNSTFSDNVEFVQDRLFNDKRYCIDTHIMTDTLNWKEEIDFDTGIHMTIDWYKQNMSMFLHK
jgi:dTDP-glucose 4,6-dehydratase